MSKVSVKRNFQSFGFSTNPTGQINDKQYTILISNQVQVGHDFKLTLYGWMKVAMLKQRICKETGLHESDIRLVTKNLEITRNNMEIQDYDIKQNSIIMLLTRNHQQAKYFINPFDILDEHTKAFKQFNEAKWEILGAFNMGITPKLTDFGTQGTYMLEGQSRKPEAIFKPYDEEAFAPNNPRGYVGKFKSKGLRHGVLSGEGVDREVAAYLLDEAYGGYHSVPTTTYVQICHTGFKYSDNQKFKQIDDEKVPIKAGSFQLFVKHDSDSGNFGSQVFPLTEAHKIAILDIRILNCDRNEENILVNKRRIQQPATQKNERQAYDYQLIPIDHGYSFPDCFKICQDEIVWFHWDQMLKPFTAEELKFIDRLNPEADANLVRSKLKFREICLRNTRISTMLLKIGAKNELTIHDISTLLFREDPDVMSEVELAIQQAEDNYELGNRVPNKVFELKNSFLKNTLIQKSLEFKPKSQKKLELSDQKDTQQSSVLQTIRVAKNLNAILEEESNTNENNKQQRVRSVPRVQENGQRKESDQQNRWSEEFYPHIEYFLQNLVDQKFKDMHSPKKPYRERYHSFNPEK